MSFLNHEYYDHPEGKDAYGKLVATNKQAACVGLIWSTYDVLMLTKPQGYFKTLSRYVYWTGPLMGMATAFTITTYAANQLRDKDDKLNYVLGGAAAGGIVGAWRRSVIVGGWGVLVFSIAAAVKKLSIEEGWEFFPPYRRRGHGWVNSARTDWTLMKDPPKNWTTGNE